MRRGGVAVALGATLGMVGCAVTFEDYPEYSESPLDSGGTGGGGPSGGKTASTGGGTGGSLGGDSGDAGTGDLSSQGGGTEGGGTTGGGTGGSTGGDAEGGGGDETGGTTGGGTTGGGTTGGGTTGGGTTGGGTTGGGTGGATGGTTGGTTGGGTTGGSSACEPTGSCSDGDGMDCAEGESVPRNCDGCYLLATCSLVCCSSVGAFAAQNTPEYLERPELIVDFSHDTGSAELDLFFDGADQFGAISWILSTGLVIDPNNFAIAVDTADGTAAGFVSVSFEDGAGQAGCVYDVDPSGLLYLPARNCWGSFTATSTVRQINVRFESSSSGTATLLVAGLGWS